MVRFSCFPAHILSPKHEKMIQQSSESMHKTLDCSSQDQALKNSSELNTESKPCLKEGEHTINCAADHLTDYSRNEHDYRSEEMDGKDSTERDVVVHEKTHIRKCQSLGSLLNWEERVSAADGSEEEIMQRFSSDESHDRSMAVALDTIDNNELSDSNQLQDPLPSDSVQVDSDAAKNMSIFSIGDPEQTLEGGAVKDNIVLSVQCVSGDVTPHTGHIIKSSSLPRLGSPKQYPASSLSCSRSAEDLITLESLKKGMDGVGRQVKYQERHNSVHNDDENTGENHADETNENYNYGCSAKDWIIPVSGGPNTQKDMKGDHWNYLPAKDFHIKRIEDWVIDIQHCSPLDESNESVACYVQETEKANALFEEPLVSKVEVKVNPGMEAAKRYISSLNALATAAHLCNLGLQVIPFLSAFGSLKSLNLSGNAIVRIAAGALPRGLHVLNLSRNSISTIEGLRDLQRLRVLDLSYNRILRIGHGLGACSSIKELYLAGNKISEVEGLHRLLKLNVLDLRFNKISTTKSLGQLAANYCSLQALSLEGNPAQKNIGGEQLKKYLLSLLTNLTYYDRQPIKVGTMKDAGERSSRKSMSSHQIDHGHRVEAKTTRKTSHSTVIQKAASFSSNHGRRGQAFASPKSSRSRHAGLPPSGMKTTTAGNQLDLCIKRNNLSFPRSRSEGNLGAL